jgi:ribosomal-protein-alanine N-acetyltransferase
MKGWQLPEQLLTIDTKRLQLRRLSLADAAAIFDYAQDPAVSQYTCWTPHRSIDDSAVFLNSVAEQYEHDRLIHWGIVLRGEDKLIGTCGFVHWHPAHARAEIGYALARPYWRKGYMTEAVRAAIAFGFHVMMLNRIEALCMPENLASSRVLEKVGMQFEGVLREYAFVKGIYLDLKLYAILKPKPTQQPQLATLDPEMITRSR